MATCTFFGHKECGGLDARSLKASIEDLIHKGVNAFYVGNQGGFDSMVYGCLKTLQLQYTDIRYSVVLAYLPTKQPSEDLSDAMYPQIEGHPKFAIDRRNKWMIHASQYCLCYVEHTWGGAYKYALLAMRRGLTVINLGGAVIEL